MITRLAIAGEKNPAYTHGHTSNGKFSPEYYSWSSMLSRCENPKVYAFKYYGGRGISVCLEWHNFERFLHDMGPRPDGCSLDRIDVNGNYNATNCRWATIKQQAINKRPRCVSNERKNLILKLLESKSLTLVELRAHLGLHREVVNQEIRKLRASGDITTASVNCGNKGKTLLCSLREKVNAIRQ